MKNIILQKWPKTMRSQPGMGRRKRREREREKKRENEKRRT